MVNRKRFCVDCGLEETPTLKLSDGLCPKCLTLKNHEVTHHDIPTIRFCNICGSFEEKGRWLRPSSKGLEENLVAFIRRNSRKFIRFQSGPLASISTGTIPTPIGSNGVLVSLSIKTQTTSEESSLPLRELDMKVRLTPTKCPNCGLMKQKYYEATLQIRAPERKMNPDEKEELLRWLDSLVQRSSENHRKSFVSKYEDKIGGFDIYLGSRQVAYSIASKFRAMRGVTTKETFKSGNIDKSTGKRSNKVTILIRMPEREVYELTKLDQDTPDNEKD